MESIRIEDARDFGRVVRIARKEAGLSQTQLAKLCGCSQRFVSEVERGKETAELGRALKLLTVLGIPVITGATYEIRDGSAEVRYAIARIASQLDKQPRKKRRLVDYLE